MANAFLSHALQRLAVKTHLSAKMGNARLSVHKIRNAKKMKNAKRTDVCLNRAVAFRTAPHPSNALTEHANSSA